MAPTTVVLYRALDEAELARLQQNGHRRLAPSEGAGTIQLLTDEAHARATAGPGWVARFSVQLSAITGQPRSGAPPREEIRVPIAQIDALNDAIVGPIVILR